MYCSLVEGGGWLGGGLVEGLVCDFLKVSPSILTLDQTDMFQHLLYMQKTLCSC